MSVQLDDAELRAHLHAIVNAETKRARDSAADQLIVELHSKEVLELWGRNLARNYGRPNDFEEVTSVITEALLMWARKLTADELAKVPRVAPHLFHKAKSAVQRWLDSAAVTLASGMSGVSRRHRIARIAVRELRETQGREPEISEVVRYVNERAMATRKNAVKQGALISSEDVEGVLLRSFSMDYEPEGGGQGDAFGTPDDGGVTIVAEVSLTLELLESRARGMFPGPDGDEIARVVAVWAQIVLDNEVPTVKSISDGLGITRRRATDRLKQVDEVLAAFRGAESQVDFTPPTV